MSFTIYALPAMLAFLTKVGIFLYDRRSNVRNLQAQVFLCFLLAFAAHNVVEIAFFTKSGDSMIQPPAFLGRLWFSTAILVVAFFLHFALLSATSSAAREGKYAGNAFVMLLYGPAIGLQALLWNGSLLIVNFEPMAYTFTKVPGPLYVLWEIYVIGYFAVAVGMLVHGAFRQATGRRRLQNKLLLLGFVPLVALALMIIGLQRVGYREFNATATLPFTSTFLLIVAAYAIYHYRLLDVAFYIPWSNARKLKTELYERIQSLSTDIRKLDSPRDILVGVATTLRCRVVLLGGPQPWTATPQDAATGSDGRLIADFPRDVLEKIDRTVTADEVADTDPALHELMKRYGVGAIVPFRSHTTISGYCLLLGEQFNEEIYSSLDFKIVDRLFSAMAQRFFEDFLLVRSQLAHVKDQLHDATRNLVRAEQNLTGVNLKLSAARRQNRSLRGEVARLRRANFRVVQPDETPKETRRHKTLDQYLAGREKEALLSALERSGGKKAVAARTLGIPLHTLNRLIERYGLDSDDSSAE